MKKLLLSTAVIIATISYYSSAKADGGAWIASLAIAFWDKNGSEYENKIQKEAKRFADRIEEDIEEFFGRKKDKGARVPLPGDVYAMNCPVGTELVECHNTPPRKLTIFENVDFTGRAIELPYGNHDLGAYNMQRVASSFRLNEANLDIYKDQKRSIHWHLFPSHVVNDIKNSSFPDDAMEYITVRPTGN